MLLYEFQIAFLHLAQCAGMFVTGAVVVTAVAKFSLAFSSLANRRAVAALLEMAEGR